jgi:hypothetical protein
MTKKTKYSVKSSAIFLALALFVLVAFGLVSQNTDLFKGQLTLSQQSETFDPGLILEVQNCGTECSTPSLIFNNLQPIESVEILVRNSFDGEVVYADYISEVEENGRYEVAFSSDICGQYSFDGITSRYNLDANSSCDAGTYDYLVSAASQGAFYTEFASFILTE